MGMNLKSFLMLKIVHHFNPHPRMGVNFHLLLPVSEIQSFNPHPRMGMNKKAMQQIVDRENFNPHPCKGGWTSYYQLKGNHNLFQPTSSTWGMNGFVVFTNQSYDNITTHIPVWGWTGNYLKLIVYGVYISIHTPAWGRTIVGSAEDLWICISTHTPAWGWTAFIHVHSAMLLFQPTPPYGDEQRSM